MRKIEAASEKVSALRLAGNNAITTLTAIAMMSRTEYATYSLPGEENA